MLVVAICDGILAVATSDGILAVATSDGILAVAIDQCQVSVMACWLLLSVPGISDGMLVVLSVMACWLLLHAHLVLWQIVKSLTDPLDGGCAVGHDRRPTSSGNCCSRYNHSYNRACAEAAAIGRRHCKRAARIEGSSFVSECQPGSS
jgi:hypothetical protein